MENKNKKLSEILQEQIAELTKKVEKIQENNLSQSNLSTTSTKTHQHSEDSTHKSLEDILNCPSCMEKVKEKLKPALEKELIDKIKNKELMKCVNCGEIVDRKQSSCPTCKGTDGKPIY